MTTDRNKIIANKTHLGSHKNQKKWKMKLPLHVFTCFTAKQEQN